MRRGPGAPRPDGPEESGQGAVARVIVVPVIRNASGEVLICRMPQDRGVFPGSWSLPGGGMEVGETTLEALRREIREELGLALVQAEPLFFKEALRPKRYPDGSTRMVHMIFLLYDCRVDDAPVQLNEEFDAYAWAPPERLSQYALDDETRDTLVRLGLMARPGPAIRDAKPWCG